jgi:uncharacterized protein YutD
VKRLQATLACNVQYTINEINSGKMMFELTKQELKDYGYVRSLKINWKKYKKVNQLEHNSEPIVHCIKNAQFDSVVIPGFFDSAEYMALNPEVLESDLHPLVHYEESKKLNKPVNRPSFFTKKRASKTAKRPDKTNLECVLFSRQELEDFFYLYVSPIHWINFQSGNISGDEIDLICYAVKDWKTNRIVIKGVYDSDVYLAKNEDVKMEGVNPLVHFFKHGSSEKRISKLTNENRQFEISTIRSQNINWDGFFEFNLIPDNKQCDPVEYYVDNWHYENLRIKGFFDSAFYLKNYIDISAIGMNPLFHFVTNGMEEGRKGFLDIAQYIELGQQSFDENLPTIAIVSHESSATGAPLVGLNLGNSLNSRHNVMHFVVRKKQIHGDFLAGSCFTITNLTDNPRFFTKALVEAIIAKYPLIGAVCNSVETFEILDVLSELKVPTVSLIHEFSDYTLPKGKISSAICFADRSIVPANIIKNSITREIKECFGIDAIPNSITVQPQGHLPYIPTIYGDNLTADELKQKFDLSSEQVLIVGAGYVQIRKGVDLFIAVANYLNIKSPGRYKFVWAGDGYDPDNDLAYSVWLKKQIIESNLEDDFSFLPHQRSLGNLLSITDVFMLTSRLDPFPNVVIDALASGVHVACFANSTGCAEFLENNESSSSIASYADVSGMADKIESYVVRLPGVVEQTIRTNQDLVSQHLDFEKYAQYILTEIEEANRIVAQRRDNELSIAQSGLFDYHYYALLDSYSRGLDHYVKCALKGMHFSNPNPAFHDGLWVNSHPEHLCSVPLSEAIAANQHFTHNNTLLDGDFDTVDIRCAIHLHLYYLDMAEFFIEKFAYVPRNCDLYITVCSKHTIEQVKQAFSKSGFDFIDVVAVENEGRDIIPFFSGLKKPLFESEKYDVVGHFHSKKSLDNDTGFGDNWLNYLTDNLLPSTSGINQIFSLFTNVNLGLVFAADHHIVDYGKNKPFADDLCSAMQIEHLNKAANFPVGTMFWAKPEALSRLFELDMQPFIQQEPLGYDGSYMHAIERLLPHVVENSGYEITTVYTQGTSW